MENPNPYDHAAFLEASNSFQGSVEEQIRKLWAAGATLANLEEELANVLDNALESDFAVRITEES